MAGDRPILVGLVSYVLLPAAPVVVCWVVLRVLPRIVEAVRRRRAGPELPPPIESLVADLRRLRAELCGPPPRTHLRRAALVVAYDQTLADVCRAVGVPVGSLVGGGDHDRDFARLQVEAALEAAGVALDPPDRVP